MLTGENCATRYDTYRDTTNPGEFFRLQPGGHSFGGGDRSGAAKDLARDVRFGYCAIAVLGCAEGPRAVFTTAGAS